MDNKKSILYGIIIFVLFIVRIQRIKEPKLSKFIQQARGEPEINPVFNWIHNNIRDVNAFETLV